MARPFKQGLEYFPFDVGFFSDPKIKKLKMKCGSLGVLVYIRILTLVYENGYYLEVSLDDLVDMIFHDLQSPSFTSIGRISTCIRFIAGTKLLDSSLVAENVITSVATQKQWLTSTSRRKNIDKSKYWLLSEYDEAKIKKFSQSCGFSASSENDNVDNNSVNVSNNLINVDNNTQKEKKKKNDKKINKDKRDLVATYGAPNLHYITKCLIDDGYIKANDINLFNFNEVAATLVGEFGFEMVLSVTNYLIKYSKREDVIIENRFEYFKESAFSNCEMLNKQSTRGNIDYGKEIDEFIEKLVNKNRLPKSKP